MAGSKRAPKPKDSSYEAREQGVKIDPAQLALFKAEILADLKSEPESQSFAELWEWWRPRFLKKRASWKSFEGRVRLHVLPKLGGYTSRTLNAGVIEELLDEKLKTRGPQTVSHIRNHISKIINDAKRCERWPADNPVSLVEMKEVKDKMREVRGKKRQMLSPEECYRLIHVMSLKWACLFALAIALGLRKGELLALLKEDLDTRRWLLRVCRSNERNTTKNGEERIIPVPEWIQPMLLLQLDMTPGLYLFGGKDGSLRSRDTKLHQVLARGLGRAGIVDGYQLLCRKCGYAGFSHERLDERCPNQCMKLWITPLPIQMTFHGLRHVSSTLHREAECDPLVIQKMLGHTAKGITDSVYTHLTEAYCRKELSKLKIEPEVKQTSPEANELEVNQVHTESEVTHSHRPSKPRVVGSSPARRALGLPEKGLFTVSEVAALLRVHPDTVRGFFHSGKLRGFWAGAHLRFEADAVAEFVESGSAR